MKKVKLFEEYIQEATTSWSKMMKGVKAGDGGPWSIVAIEYNKVVGQSIDIKIRDLIPAKYEALKKEFPRAKFHIEDGGGQVVWNESFINEATQVQKDLASKIHNTIEGDEANKKTILNAMHRTQNQFNPLTVNIVTGYEGSTGMDNRLDRLKTLSPTKLNLILKELNTILGITESFVNEAKDATREELMDLMETKYKIRSVRPSEEFDGQTEGIWIAADNEEMMGGNKIFDYYNTSAKYKNGVLKTVVDAVEKKGWWFSWNDPGTMMIWPKN